MQQNLHATEKYSSLAVLLQAGFTVDQEHSTSNGHLTSCISTYEIFENTCIKIHYITMPMKSKKPSHIVPELLA
jgi:hypothetical protein